MALQDISKYMNEEKIKIVDKNNDVLVVSASMLDSIENRKLNRKLGLNKVNYTKKAMNRKTIKN